MKGQWAVCVLVLCGFLGFVTAAVGRAHPSSEKLKADEIVSKHLEAIGSASARAAVKSLVVEGNMTVKYVMGGTGEAGGPFSLVSTGDKLSFAAKFNMTNYPGEFFAFDGEKKSVGYVQPGQRSQLEDFLNNNGEIIQEGLVGGTLSTAWPLYNWQARKAKLDSDGLKKEEGKELYKITYHPRHGGGDLKVYLFFDPSSFHLVKIIYTEQVAPQMGTSPGLSSSGGLARLTLEENFGGFTNVEGLMLPTQWSIKYSSEGAGYGTSILEYDLAVAKIQPNMNTSGQSFKVQQ
jgi:hypothetical protein